MKDKQKKLEINEQNRDQSLKLSRRETLAFGIGASVVGCLAFGEGVYGQTRLQSNKEIPTDLEIIDCHTHFYDPTRAQGVPWPPKDSTLYRKVMPENMRELPQYRRVTGTVIVEASEWIEDNQWLLDLAKNDPWIVGIVGRLDPMAGPFGEQLKRFATNPLYRGIRIWEDRLRPLLEKNDIRSFAQMADLGIAADINGSSEVLDLAADLAKRLPKLTIVLNHIGNVAITQDPPPVRWAKSIAIAAAKPNVYCKISALAEGAGRDGRKAPSDLDFYRPTLDTVWNAFGEDRVIYGSNWPVCELAADYRTVQQLSTDYIAEKGEAALRKFCSENAAKAYGWKKR